MEEQATAMSGKLHTTLNTERTASTLPQAVAGAPRGQPVVPPNRVDALKADSAGTAQIDRQSLSELSVNMTQHFPSSSCSSNAEEESQGGGRA